jgi:GNAT superfamily N-acetyltransferase
MNAPESNGTYLTDATPAQLEEAVALNHLELFALNALAAGGEVRRDGDVTFSYAGPDGEGVIAFPRLPDDRAGERLDEIVAFYLERRPERLVGCWSLAPPRPPDLGVRLLARGFQPGWRPCWMALDLNRMNENHPRPEGLVIEADEAMAVWGVKGLPYSEDRDVGTARETARNHPGRFRHFVAKEGSRVVGHSTALLTHGPLGVAGIYDVGVIEEARNRGVGKAVTLAACRWARERGCRYAVLNATGRRMYEQAGFEWIGDGWTWWLNVPRLAENPPTPER